MDRHKPNPYKECRKRREARTTKSMSEGKGKVPSAVVAQPPLTSPTPPFPKPLRKTKTEAEVDLTGEYSLPQLKNILSVVKSKKKVEEPAEPVETPSFHELEYELQRQEVNEMEKLRLIQRDLWDARTLTRQQGRPEPTFSLEENPRYWEHEQERLRRRLPVLHGTTSLHYFQSPPNRLPTSWGQRPGTPLQFIYGAIANHIPTRSYQDKRKGVNQAIENGFVYRRIKNAMKTSVYSRKAQLDDFKKHQAFLQCKHPVADIEKFNAKLKMKAKASEKASSSQTSQYSQRSQYPQHSPYSQSSSSIASSYKRK